MAARADRVRTHVCYSRPGPADVLGVGYDAPGRLDGENVLRAVGPDAAAYYLCGPLGFMAGMRRGLEDAGVPTERIHQEVFGPAA